MKDWGELTSFGETERTLWRIWGADGQDEFVAGEPGLVGLDGCETS